MTDAHQRYRVIDRLASGGMAEVFLAESAGIEGFKKRVAIKRVLPHLSKKERFIGMFLDEARLSAHMSHSNVAQVFDIGVGDDTFFIVMEFVDGADLKSILEAMKKNYQTISVEQAVFITLKICEGLAYAHDLCDHEGNHLHIVHRDVSPPNIIVSKYGEVKIVDFGLAKARSQLEVSEPGIIKGKFSYLSPESAVGKQIDHRSDIFAVGILLWEMLAGRRLFLGDSDFKTVQLVQNAVLPQLVLINPSVPAELEVIIGRALAKAVEDRYSSALEFGKELTKFLFQYGKPVNAFDIAVLVEETIAFKKKERSNQPSIIQKLIDQTLLEFTSLQANETESPKSSARKSLPMASISKLDISIPSELRTPIGKTTLGNLSALEDQPNSILSRNHKFGSITEENKSIPKWIWVLTAVLLFVIAAWVAWSGWVGLIVGHFKR